MCELKTIKPNEPTNFTPTLGNYRELEPFRFWCQKILPLVYDDSLSYYELLCKVVDYINKIIENDEELLKHINELNVKTNEELSAIKKDLTLVQEWINNFNSSYAETIIKNTLATMIFINIDDSHIIFYIPEEWKDITFSTQGLDENLNDVDFGTLIIKY